MEITLPEKSKRYTQEQIALTYNQELRSNSRGRSLGGIISESPDEKTRKALKLAAEIPEDVLRFAVVLRATQERCGHKYKPKGGDNVA